MPPHSFLSLIIYVSCLFTTCYSALTAQELTNLQGDHSVIFLNSNNFDQILSGERDYYLSVLFTTTADHIPCDTCKKFDSKYKLVSKSYHATNPEQDSVFFAIAEFTDNEAVYKKMQMSQVPKLWVFPPSSKPDYNVTSPHFPYTISESAINDPLDFANFIVKIANVRIVIQPDFELSQFFTYFVGTFSFVLLLKKKILNKLDKALILKFIVVFATVFLTSGYMFTVIRGIPLIAKDDKGKLMYFSGGTHWQFGLETFIISSIYVVLGGLLVSLVVYIPQMKDERKKSILTMFSSFALLYVFNYLTKIFLVKDPGYPFQITDWF